MSSSFKAPAPLDRGGEQAPGRTREASSVAAPSRGGGYSGPADYLDTQRTGLRRRIVYRQPESISPLASPAAAPPPPTSVTQRLDQIGGAAGYLGTVASAAGFLHPNVVSEAVGHVPVLGAASSARTAVSKSRLSKEAYARGDFGGVLRHGVGSAASGLKAVSDAATVASGGFSAPVTVPVSTVASAVNTVTSLPEYAESASSAYRNRDRLTGQGITAVNSLPGALSSAASSVYGYLTGTPAAPPTEQQRLEAANERARTLMPEKRYHGKLD